MTTTAQATLSRQKDSAKKTPSLPYSQATYLFWYEKMLLMRRFEEKSGQLYGQQKIKGFCHLYNGQEACIAGAVTALQTGDKYITAYRDHAHPIALGTDIKYIMAELYGKVTGVSKGKGGSMHLFDKANHFFGGHGIVGGQIPLGIGIAFAEKYKKTNHLCITFLGDGAVRQGAFHESLNLAMLYELPVIFVIENNGYAMGTSVQRSSNVTDLYQLGSAYEMHSEAVEAMEVENVHQAVSKAAEKARRGIPSLLEFKTYRYRGHSISDPATYRNKEEVNRHKEKDSIELVKNTLLKHQMATSEELMAIEEKIDHAIREAVQFAENSPFPGPEAAYQDRQQKKIALFVTICLILGISGWVWMVQQKKQELTANNEMFQAVYQFEAGAYEQALQGTELYTGFLGIIDTYGMTKVANLAHFYAGVCYMHQENYVQAVQHLQQFKGKDYLLQSRAWSLIGDALVEQKEYQKATQYYKKAAAHQPNEVFSPMYLGKAAVVYETQQDYKNAISCYQQIITSYPKSSLYADAKKHMSRLEALQKLS
eukprot:gene2965-3703_t